MSANNLRQYRERSMMSKSELARRAGLSSLTVHRIELGRDCRPQTKRKLLLALGVAVSDWEKLFGSPSAEPWPDVTGRLQSSIQRDHPFARRPA